MKLMVEFGANVVNVFFAGNVRSTLGSLNRTLARGILRPAFE